jgi:exodeoxyribonuclease V alpha subunit
VDFHYLGNPQDPARHGGRTLAAPRRAAYGDLVARLSAAPLPNSEELAGVVASPWVDDLDEAFAWVDQARILTFTRKGWHGSVSVNRRIRDLLAPAWDPQGGLPGSEGFNGAPVMVQENDYARDLFNGEVGILLRLRGRYLAFFRKEEGYRPYPVPLLPRHELAFASTVHKAQGSEYDQVLLVLPEAGNRLLFKETLYTALTRARHFAGLYGPPEVFLEAAGKRVIRESGLRDYLLAALAR